jgi:hypothetical protein
MITTLLVILALQASSPPSPPSSTSSPSPSTPGSESASSTTSATRKLEEVQAAFTAVDCDKVMLLAPFVFEHRQATMAERHDAGFRHAWCAVLVGNLGEAQALFSTIVDEDVAAEPAFEIEPRVRVLLEAARGEAQKRLAAKADAARAEAIATIVLKVKAPEGLKGGARAFFDIDVEDPRRLVRGLRLEFRRAGDFDFSALPITKQSDGSWRGEIPGSFTRSTTGQTIDWFISVLDDEARLLTTHGSRAAPLPLVVAPGSSLAQDMRANERLAQETRVGLALLASPFLTGSGVLAGAFAAVIFAVVSPIGGDLALAVLPSVGAVVGTALTSSALLDPGDATVAVFTTAAFATVASGLVLLSGVDTAENAIDGAITFKSGTLLAAAGVAVIGFVASAAVPTTLVVLDAPE